ncbi:MAG TPA: hypothetical protein VFC00_33080, partial [Micromonosporaceae bacterium]|nr:hypothetical protein [Micromonosporaceae bacterium]
MTEQPRTIRTVDALAEAGLLTAEAATAVQAVARRYAISLTPAMRERIGGGPDDPVALQFVPTVEELHGGADDLEDPIGDAAFTPLPGITHRYRDRVLLKPLHVCPVYCRFCFRREQVGPGGEALDDAELDAALDYVARRPEIWEVIVTGGDPFML